MRKVKISVGEYYHIYNRGNNKQNIFFEEKDWVRFLFLILYFQSPITNSLNNISRLITNYVQHRVFNMPKKIESNIIKNRYVEVVNFVFMPNHFHLLMREVKENGISQYMQRILNSCTKYFNIKYNRTGHLFQGPFKIVRIEDNEQLLHLSAYIHRNPREIPKWKNKEREYFWSSYQDYIKENRWGELIKREIILDQFLNKEEYQDFVETSGTKLLLDETHLI